MHTFEKIAEAKIKKAITKGELDNLHGKGKPLDLSDYFRTPAKFRIIYDFLKQSGFLPQEVRLMKEISNLKEKRKSSKDQDKRIDKEISDKTTELNILKERYLKARRQRRVNSVTKNHFYAGTIPEKKVVGTRAVPNCNNLKFF